jgi:hypothetical protein
MNDLVVRSARPLLVLAAFVAALAHVPVVPPHLEEAPYMGTLFVLFIAGCAVVAALAATRPSRTVYAAAVVLCGSAVATYAATRVVAFPQLASDVGTWLEPLGVVSVLSELLVVTCALALLAATRSPRTAVRVTA